MNKKILLTSIALTLLILPALALATTDEVGDMSTSEGSQVGYVRAYRITASANGVLQTISVNVQSSAGNIRLAIYDDDAGHLKPAALIWESSSTASSSGWKDFSVSGTHNIVATNNYWIAIQANDNGFASYMDASCEGTCKGSYYVFSYNPFDASWSGSSTQNSGSSYNFRMTYAPSNLAPFVQIDEPSPNGTTLTNNSVLHQYWASDDTDVDYILKAYDNGTEIFNNVNYPNGTILTNTTNEMNGWHNFTVYAEDDEAESNMTTLWYNVSYYTTTTTTTSVSSSLQNVFIVGSAAAAGGICLNDNTTFRQNFTINNVTTIVDTPCAYGCDPETNECSMNPFYSYLIGFGIFLFLVFVAWIVYKKMK
jgi:hypothetical protein